MVAWQSSPRKEVAYAVLALAIGALAACNSTHHCAPNGSASNCDMAWQCDEGARELRCADAGPDAMRCQCLEDGSAARTYDQDIHNLGLCTPLDQYEVACTAHCSCGWDLPFDTDCACP